ncbi:MAG: glutamate--tRNA ligase [Rhizobiaceae bacterium]|nr:glutamate--tRNA ligase [Rhizobiaceae bacterium]
MKSEVVTRFAPSPTGFLHIGGARTALFNWLFAKANGGKMLLRIEDTDQARSTDEAVEAIKDGLSWLGLTWDGDPISQFSRGSRHREIAEQMVADGKAYYCYTTPEELTEMREKARAEKRSPRYDGRWRDRDPSEAPEGVAGVIRLKAPLEGDTIVHDMVQGDVKFSNKDLDDLILLRSDGSPTYMLAVVVDDHDMGVTHIIRGDDHLTNAARQILIFNALGWDVPIMAHVPLIHGPDGAKLSKRHGAVGAEAYRAMGYLPEAMRNYLVRLGWAHGDDEIIPTDQLIKLFGFDGMGKAAARFDFKKLENLNGHYIRAADDDYLLSQLELIAPEIESGAEIAAGLSEKQRAQILSAMPSLKERAKTLIELAAGTKFITATRPLDINEKAAATLENGGTDILANLQPHLVALDEWDADSIEAAIREFSESAELKLGKVAQPLRAALTGTNVSPGVFDVMVVLGKDECISRLADQLK